MSISDAAAIQVAQHAIATLIAWADQSLPQECQLSTATAAVSRAKALLGWTEQTQVGSLRLLFDQVQISNTQRQSQHHWWPMSSIADQSPKIPYPLNRPPDPAEEQNLKQEIRDQVVPILSENWENLSLLYLILEKYGASLSFGETNVALVDRVRMTGALAAALAHHDQTSHLSLVAGDLSGIQTFIYTISSAGALKSLRARSFYLELVTTEIVQQLLERLQLPAPSVIYAGGGNLFVLAPADQIERIQALRKDWNEWLRQAFQGKIFLALDSHDFPTEDIGQPSFSNHWNAVIQKLQHQKQQKFHHQLQPLLTPTAAHEPCRVCHRDDTQNLAPLNPQEIDSPLACPTCRRLFQLGGQLFKVRSMIRSQQAEVGQPFSPPIAIQVGGSANTVYYHLFENQRPIVSDSSETVETVFLINNWGLEDYQFRFFHGKAIPLLLGNYGQKTQELEQQGFMPASEMAELAGQEGCIPRVGYLRMDVDHLGQIFAKGLKSSYSLPRLAGLSRQMSYFFKSYLNSLAAQRHQNLHHSVQKLTSSDRPHLLFVYAGGDDLFVSGTWHHVVEFAFDVYQCFRAYVGHHPDISLSGGLSLAGAKFPLYQAAATAGDLEGRAKNNGRDSLGLFGQVFKWSEWLGTAPSQPLPEGDKAYLSEVERPPLLGVFPFVHQLVHQLDIGYSQGFLRNLLVTAQIREQRLQAFEDKNVGQLLPESNPPSSNQQLATAYYLHLPQLAYTLSRLPAEVRNHQQFKPIRQSLMSPRNSPYFRAIATWIDLITRTK